VAAPRLRTLVLPEGWLSLLPERAARRRTALRAVALLQNHVLPRYLAARWASTAQAVPPVTIEAAALWRDWLLTLTRLDRGDAGTEWLFLPLAIVWQQDGTALSTVPAAATTLAQVRRQATPGFLFEALADAGFVRTLACAIGTGEEIPFGGGHLALRPTDACLELLAGCAEADVHPLTEDPDNATVLGDRLILKTLHCRAPAAGAEKPSEAAAGAPSGPAQSRVGQVPDPMVEIARHLTESARFPGTPALAGHIDGHFDDDCGGNTPCTLALLEQYVPNQGNLAARVRDLLQRLCDEYFAAGSGDAWREDPGQIGFAELADRLGARIGELHAALAYGRDDEDTANGAFRPEPMAEADHERLREALQATAVRAVDALRDRRDALPAAAAEAADRLLAAETELHAGIDRLSRHGFGPLRCRIHGDLRLARVLVAQSEPVLIDAGGPAHRPPAERRAKRPPLSDLGTLVCDLHTAVAQLQQRQRAEHPDIYPRLVEPLATWRRQTVDRLLAAHAVAAEGSLLLAADPAQRAEAAWALALGCALDCLEAAVAASPQAPPAQLAAAIAAVLSLHQDAAAASGG
jgi:maltose alpha-D-glucosyltransferase/alpha-amylase